MVTFGIGTADSFSLYTSCSTSPLIYMSNFHMAPLSDVSWFKNKMIGISS